MKINRRLFLAGASLAALSAKDALAWVHGSGLPSPVDNVWMATPDIVAFTVNDPAIIPGNLVSGSFSGDPYGTWFQMTNPLTGANEWCAPLGINRTQVRFSDKPPATSYLNKVALRTLGNYTVTNATATAVYYRDEANGQGDSMAQSSGLTARMITQRHTVYLKLASIPSNGTRITISNSQANTFSQFSFTYHDKVTRAGGIQVNQIGQRPDDSLRYGYLAVRIPGGPNSGTVDFINEHGLTSFQILNSAKVSVFTGSIVQRVNSGPASAEGFNSGIDVADMSVAYAVTGMTRGNPTLINCPGHPFSNGDKVRTAGTNGMFSASTSASIDETKPVGAAGVWVAPSVTVIDADNFSIDVNTSSGFTAWSATTNFSEALGGINNKIFKCFNTNRAGTYVFGLDFSSWTPAASGTYYLYIPGYGISDPFLIQSDAWAVAAGKTHQGIFNLRLGCAVNSDSGYSRGVALADGVDGCANYQSTFPAIFASECQSSIVPTGAPIGSDGNPTAIRSSLGAYVDIGTFTLSGLTRSGTTATATTTAPHGITVGQYFAIQPTGFTPAGYNSVDGSGAGLAQATGASTFTYTVSSSLAASANVSAGVVRTGFVTTTRTGTVAAAQDAGDNDDIAIDHMPGYKLLALVFRNIPKASRFTPYTVPLSTTLLNPTLFAGTDSLPPLFHELFWYAEQYRLGQQVDGSIWGGYGVGKFSAQIADYPETIDKYHGTDAGGALTGQTVMGFAYARDHYTAFLYAGLAAQLAQIAYDYSLTTLGDTYRDSAIAAYAWADSLATDVTACDAYYNGVLNLQAKAGWSTTTYNDAMYRMNGNASGIPRKTILAKFDAAGSLFRLLGSTAGAAYGAFIIDRALYNPAVSASGSGYAVNDYITISGGTFTLPMLLLVTGVNGSGGVTSVVTMHQGQYTSVPSISGATTTTGSGVNATFTFSNARCLSLATPDNNCGIGGYDYCATTGADSAAVTSIRTNYQINGNAAIGLSANQCYMGMQFDASPATTRINFMGLAAPLKALISHLLYVQVNGVVAGAYTSTQLQLMQAGCSFQLGANLPNKAFQSGTGPRPFICFLHEDSFKYGTPAPYGLIPYGYFGYASSLMFFNFAGIGISNGDSQTNCNSDNVSGSYESYATPGSAKMWNPWRFGSAFWEWSPENRNIIFNSEFDLTGSQLNTIAVQLYLHGWDGNT